MYRTNYYYKELYISIIVAKRGEFDGICNKIKNYRIFLCCLTCIIAPYGLVIGIIFETNMNASFQKVLGSLKASTFNCQPHLKALFWRLRFTNDRTVKKLWAFINYVSYCFLLKRFKIKQEKSKIPKSFLTLNRLVEDSLDLLINLYIFDFRRPFFI